MNEVREEQPRREVGEERPRREVGEEWPRRDVREERPRREIRHRSEWEIRWRQARNAPPPVVRAVLANIVVATIGGVVLLLTDWLASRGVLPRFLLDLGPLVYVVVVIVSGSLFTYLWVELPTGVPGEKRRSPWSAVLGFFASIPIVYLALVIIFELLRPLLPG